MKLKLLFLSFILLPLLLFAQENDNDFFCASDALNQELMKEDKGFAERVNSMNKKISNLTKAKKLASTYNFTNGLVYEIPIVVHIIHEGDPIGTGVNISDTGIETWIENVNKIFATTYLGMDSPQNGGAAIPVRLVLAKRSPQCGSTNGIVRVDARSVPGYSEWGIALDDKPGADAQDIRDLTRWDPNYYYNIYLVKNIQNAGGFAYYPGVKSSLDGAFIKYYNQNYFNFVLAHEIGHALGLMHTFDGSNNGNCPLNNDCTLQGDMVCDTEPIVHINTISCPSNSSINNCTGTFYTGSQKSIMSYYTNCYSRFTPGQRDRAVIHTLEYRENLLNSLALKEPETNSSVNLSSTCTPNKIINSGINWQMGPYNIVFGDINYKSTGYSGDNDFYIDNTSSSVLCLNPYITTKLEVGKPTPLTISIGGNTQNVIAYIDYNNDGIFDEATEKVYEAKMPEKTQKTIDVVPPNTAVLNKPLRMRVIADWITTNISACYTPEYGQVEDFSVSITDNNLDIDEAITDNDNKIQIYTHNQSVFINSKDSYLNKIEIFDITGRLLYSNNKINLNKFEIPYAEIGDKANIIVVKIQTNDYLTITKKVILK